jgi:hypothetical protein
MTDVPRETCYLPNVLTAFEAGCMLDLRVRLAIEFLKTNTALTDGVQALKIASDLCDEAEKRGFIMPLPDDDSLSRPLRMHLKRQVRAQSFQQGQAAVIGKEEAPKVLTAANSEHPAPLA